MKVFLRKIRSYNEIITKIFKALNIQETEELRIKMNEVLRDNSERQLTILERDGVKYLLSKVIQNDNPMALVVKQPLTKWEERMNKQIKKQKEMENQENTAKATEKATEERTETIKVQDENGNYYFLRPDGTKFNYVFVKDASIVLVYYNYEKRILTFRSGFHRPNTFAPVSELVHRWITQHGIDSTLLLSGTPKSINEIRVYDNPFKVIKSINGKFYVSMVWEGEPNEPLLEPRQFRNFIMFKEITDEKPKDAKDKEDVQSE